MSNPSNPQPKPKREIMSPNVVAFFSGVLLAFVVGMAFRTWIERMKPEATAMRAVSPEYPTESELQPEQTDQAKEALPKTAATTAADIQPSEAQESEATEPPTALQVKVNSPTSLVQEERVTENAAGEVDYMTWRRQFRAFEEKLMTLGLTNLNVTMTPRYRHQARGLAITRGQFLDVVSKKVPTNLPTRPATSGLVLYALSPVDFDPQQFTLSARDSITQLEPLCRTDSPQVKLGGVERLTVLLSNSPQYFKCLIELIKQNPDFIQVQEITFVAFTRGSTFFASLSSQKKLVSLQMWNLEWLLDNTVGLQETGKEEPRARRSARLANVARALGQPSDVRIQIPASFRPLAGPYNDPANPTPPKSFVFGNFALLPSHMPRGSLVATTFTSPGQERSKSATTKPPGSDKTKALILATQGKQLQFTSVSRE